jgi:hypothetical protein
MLGVTAWDPRLGPLQLGPGDRLDLPPKTPHATAVVGLGLVVYVTGKSEPQTARRSDG